MTNSRIILIPATTPNSFSIALLVSAKTPKPMAESDSRIRSLSPPAHHDDQGLVFISCIKKSRMVFIHEIDKIGYSDDDHERRGQRIQKCGLVSKQTIVRDGRLLR